VIGNPEFTRNIWLQCSWPRLLAAAIVIGILYYAATYFGSAGSDVFVSGGRWLFGFIIGLWGTRRAADSLAEEVGGNTWETQRMSGLSAWQMAWGKLLGGTAYPWFCALLCLALMDVTALQHGSKPRDLLLPNADLILSGLSAHAVSLSVALLLLRKAQLRRRLMVTFAQVCGLVVYANSWFGDVFNLFSSVNLVNWYGHLYPVLPFHLASLAVFSLWAWFGLYRLMRLELQYRNWPWAWVLFLAYAMLYVAGFNAHDGEPMTTLLAGPLGFGVLITYLSFLAEAKDPVRYRWGLLALRAGDIGKALGFLPLWLISYVATAGVAIAVILLLPAEPLTDLGQSWLSQIWVDATSQLLVPRPQVLIAAGLLFLARDILFLLLLNFGSWRQRADIAGLIYLLIAYFPLASIIGFVGSYRLLPIVVPFDAGNAVMTFGPVFAEIAALSALLLRRWRLQIAIRPAKAAA
jgi:hypothetical protein